MRIKKTIAVLLAVLMLFSTQAVFASEDTANNVQVTSLPGDYEEVIDPQQYIMLMQQAIELNTIDYSQYEVNEELSDNNNQPVDKLEGSAPQNVIYQIATDNDQTAPTTIPVTATPVPEDRPRGPVNPDIDVSPSPEPSDSPRGPVNPDIDVSPSPEPSDSPRGPVNPDIDVSPSPEPSDSPRGPVNPDIDVSPSPEPSDSPRGPVNPDIDVSPSPEPSDSPRGPVNPDVTEIPSPTGEIPSLAPSETPVPSAAAEATPTAVPTVTAAPTAAPTLAPTATPVPVAVNTPIPTPYVPEVILPKNPTEPVIVVPREDPAVPRTVSYDIGIEVGRHAYITTGNQTNSTKKSSNTKIIGDPYEDVSSFASNKYIAKAYYPGDAVITFANSSLTELWNVHVYTRPIDFEKTQYVVQKHKKDYEYVTLSLKYFEYKSEFAYDFTWDSSNKDVAIVYGGDSNSTYCRFRIAKAGTTIITVSDKYGRSSSAVLIVKPEDVPTPTPTEAPAPTKVPDKTEPEVTPSAEVTSAPAPTAQPGKDDPSKLTDKQIKKRVKNAETAIVSVKAKSGYITLSWDDNCTVDLDGYELQYSLNKKFKTDKKFKTKTVDLDSDTDYKFISGKNGKKYYFRVRGYKEVGGKTVYTAWSDKVSKKFKK